MRKGRRSYCFAFTSPRCSLFSAPFLKILIVVACSAAPNGRTLMWSEVLLLRDEGGKCKHLSISYVHCFSHPVLSRRVCAQILYLFCSRGIPVCLYEFEASILLGESILQYPKNYRLLDDCDFILYPGCCHATSRCWLCCSSKVDVSKWR